MYKCFTGILNDYYDKASLEMEEMDCDPKMCVYYFPVMFL